MDDEHDGGRLLEDCQISSVGMTHDYQSPSPRFEPMRVHELYILVYMYMCAGHK